MKFTTNFDYSLIEGTWLQGYTTATRRELEAAFGAPAFEDEGDKVTTEWEILFDDGIVATIYDWKRYEMGAPAMDERIEWNIGGRDPIAVERVKDALLVRA